MIKRRSNAESEKTSPISKVPITQRLNRQFQQIQQMFSQAVKIHKISDSYYEIQVLFFFKNSQSRHLSTFTHKSEEKTIAFVIIIHEMYPFKAPLVVSSSHVYQSLLQVMFPRLDDYRDFMDHLIQNWWPSIKIVQVIEKLDEFVKSVVDKSVVNLLNPILETSFLLGRLKPSMTCHHLGTIDRNCKGAKLCRGEYFEKQEDVLVGKYQKMVVCISWSNITLFKETPENEKYLRIIKSMPTKDIKKLKIKNKMIKEKKSKGKTEAIYFYDVNIQLGDKNEYVRITTLKPKELSQNPKVSDAQVKAVNSSKLDHVQDQEDQGGSKQKVACHLQQSFSQSNKVVNEFQIIQDCRDQDHNKSRKYSFEDQFRQQDSHIKINFEEQIRKIEAKCQLEQEDITQQKMEKAKVGEQRQIQDIFQSLKCVQLLRNISQYIQLREFFLLPENQLHDTQIRILTQIIQNSSDLQGQQQLQLFYQMKLKEVICKKVLAIERNEKGSFASNKSFSQF